LEMVWGDFERDFEGRETILDDASVSSIFFQLSSRSKLNFQVAAFLQFLFSISSKLVFCLFLF
jgi:hypothetical protein